MNQSRQETPNIPKFERFVVRPLADSDAALYVELYSDAETMRYIGAPLSAELAARSFRAALRQTTAPRTKTFFLVVTDAMTSTPLGVCGATLGVPRLGDAEVGIVLTKATRRQGFSYGAFGRFIDHVFQTFRCERVWVRYTVGHIAVERMIGGLGFSTDLELSTETQPRQWREASLHRNMWHGVVSNHQQGTSICQT